MDNFLSLFARVRWQDIADIFLVSFIFYQGILLIKGTRAVQVIFGLGVVMIVLIISQNFRLETTNWILNSFLSSIILVIVILFQSDIRKVLSRMVQSSFFFNDKNYDSTLEEIIRAVLSLASRMVGALIVLERSVGLAGFVETGVILDARVSRELLLSIFQSPGPLHDGAIIIRGNKIIAARCLLPLSTNPNLNRHLGTRHRAGVGLSEESDAICVIVSEERGRVSVAVEDKITFNLDAAELRKLLHDFFYEERKKYRSPFFYWRERSDV